MKARSNSDSSNENFLKRVEEKVNEKMKTMKKCKKGEEDDDEDEDGKNRTAGTNVFEGKINATNALGFVGYTNWSINRAPYEVERCDQILLIHGKKLNLDNYCEKEDAFMTMSIYMINFFTERDSNKLIESYPMNEITAIPTPLAGAPGCF